MLRRVLPASVTVLGEDEVEIVMSTATLARDGHILVPEGCLLENYRRNPIQLWQHDANIPVGTNENIRVTPTAITALSRFAPLGISQKADEVRGLVKAGIVKTVSISFEILESEPLDPKRPRGGQRATKWELFECSWVTVPADVNAVVTAREKSDGEDWKIGASRSLPVDASDEWNAAEAEKSIFDWAGGDAFKESKARKAFLVYNAAKPSDRSSYKLPIARVSDGRMKISKTALRTAATQIHSAGIPDDIRSRAEAVLKFYKEKAGMGDETTKERARLVAHKRFLEDRKERLKLRGLYQVAELACLVQNVGYAKDAAEWEAAFEEDASEVPSMIGESLVKLGEALIAMTEEEVAELLDGVKVDMEGGDDEVAERKKIARKAIWDKAFRKSKKDSSAGNEDTPADGQDDEADEGAQMDGGTDHLQEAQDHHKAAKERHRSLGEAHKNAAQSIADSRAAHERAMSNHKRLGDAIASAHAEPEEADGHLKRAMDLHAKLADDHHDTARAMQTASHYGDDGDVHHTALGRSIRSAAACVRAFVEGGSGTPPNNSKVVQKSGGTSEDEGSRSSDYRRRQAEKLSLATPV